MSSLIASFACSQSVQRLALPRLFMDAAQRRNALLELGLPIVGMLVIHMVQGHYHRRIPFWSESRQVILSCIIGRLTSGLFASITPADVTAISDRDLAGDADLHPQSAASYQTRSGPGRSMADPVLIVGDRMNVQSASAVLLSEPIIGYHVVGCENSASLALIAGELGWQRLLQRYGAQLVIVASIRNVTRREISSNRSFACIFRSL